MLKCRDSVKTFSPLTNLCDVKLMSVFQLVLAGPPLVSGRAAQCRPSSTAPQARSSPFLTGAVCKAFRDNLRSSCSLSCFVLLAVQDFAACPVAPISFYSTETKPAEL